MRIWCPPPSRGITSIGFFASYLVRTCVLLLIKFPLRIITMEDEDFVVNMLCCAAMNLIQLGIGQSNRLCRSFCTDIHCRILHVTSTVGECTPTRVGAPHYHDRK